MCGLAFSFYFWLAREIGIYLPFTWYIALASISGRGNHYRGRMTDLFDLSP
jgi:hypothetical protein